MSPVKGQPGTYALVLVTETVATIQIGRLGTLQTRPGYYVYVGTAFGPGGVAARLHHHLNPVRRPHWHIDYLRQATQVKEVWYTHHPVPQEHTWANLLAQLPQIAIPLPRFGASDCRCPSHLFYFETTPPLAQLPYFIWRLEIGD